MKTSSFILTAAALATPGFAQGGDDCAMATAVGAPGTLSFDTTTATTSAFNGGGTCAPGADTINQDLFWQYTATTAGMLVVDTFGTTFDTQLSVHAGTGCAATCAAYNDDSGGFQSQVTITGVSAGDTFLIQVGGFGADSGPGSLNIASVAAPSCAAADALEDNDDCGTAVAIPGNAATGLNVDDLDLDFYSITLPAGSILTVDITFADVLGDLDLYLWDPSVACGTATAGEGFAPIGSLATGFEFGSVETITYTNTTGAVQDLILEVDVWDGGSDGACNSDYSMTITGVIPGGGPMNLGVPFCMANNNSTGVPGLISATGSIVAADNDVTLNVEQIPALQFGIFTVAAMAGGVTLVNQGILCLSGPTGRYSMPGQIWQADSMGEASLVIDLSVIPTPTALVPTNAGDTWFFQAWHRDVPPPGAAAGSNFTNGVEITFN